MTVFLATVIVFAVALLALGLGTILGRPPLRGSCGGMGQCACGATSEGDCRRTHEETACITLPCSAHETSWRATS